MTEFSKVRIVTRYELLKQLRRRRFLGALIIIILATVLMIGLYRGLDLPQQMGIPEPLLEEYGAEIFAIFVTSMGSLAILAAVFFSGDAIASEFEQRTGYVLFPNPVKRITLVVGKYLACFIATSIIILVGYVISIGGLFLYYGEVPVGLWGSLGLVLMLACSVISFAFFYSSLLKGSMGATIATLLTILVFSSIISTSLAYAGYNPWFMPDRAMDAMASTYDLPIEELAGGFWGGSPMMGGMVEASSDPKRSFLVSLTYAIVLFSASIWITDRREMI